MMKIYDNQYRGKADIEFFLQLSLQNDQTQNKFYST